MTKSPKKVNMFYIALGDHGILKSELNGIADKQKFSFDVMHRQLCGKDIVCASFYFECCTVSRTRAQRAAKVFCKQMNTYYPLKVQWTK